MTTGTIADYQSQPAAHDPEAIKATAKLLESQGCAFIALRKNSDKARAFAKGESAGKTHRELTQQSLGKVLDGTATGIELALGTAGSFAPSVGHGRWYLVAFEIESPDKATPEFIEQLGQKVSELGLAQLYQHIHTGYMEQSPSGGLHVIVMAHAMNDAEFTAAMPDNLNVAWRGVTAAELRATAIVVAPSHSVHKSGQAYQVLRGRSIFEASQISLDQLRQLGQLCEAATDGSLELKGGMRRVSLDLPTTRARRAAELYNAHADAHFRTAELLSKHGWRHHSGAIEDEAKWSRPGATSDGHDASSGAGEGRPPGVVVWSSSDAVLSQGQHDHFAVYARLEHGGDADQAALTAVASGLVYLPDAVTSVAIPEVDPKNVTTRDYIKLLLDALSTQTVEGHPDLARFVHQVDASGGSMLFHFLETPTSHRTMQTLRGGPLDEVVQKIKVTKNGADFEHGHPPSVERSVEAAVISNSLSAKGIARIHTISTDPVLLRDGRVVREHGLHRDAGVLITVDPNDVSDRDGYVLPDNITRVEAQQAFNFIDTELFADFPFDTPGDRARAHAAFLTFVTRHLVKLAPMCVFDAPDRATGKSMLAEAIRIAGTGSVEYMRGKPDAKQDAESEKDVVTATLSGKHTIHFDDIERGSALNSHFYSELLTAPPGRMHLRRLGGNTEVGIKAFTVTAAGNNVMFGKDYGSRSIAVRLAEKDGIAQERTLDSFRHSDLIGWVERNRPALLAAAHTLVSFGLQNPVSKQWKIRFGEWAGVVLGSLAHVALGGIPVDDLVMEGREEWTAENDGDADDWNEFALALYKHTDAVGRRMAMTEIVSTLNPDRSRIELPPELHIALGQGTRSIAKSWGHHMAKMKDTAIPLGDGVILRMHQIKSNGTLSWHASARGDIEGWLRRRAETKASVAPVRTHAAAVTPIGHAPAPVAQVPPGWATPVALTPPPPPAPPVQGYSNTAPVPPPVTFTQETGFGA